MKLGKHSPSIEKDTRDMSDLHLRLEYDNLISDQVVANAVMAILLKLEIDRRANETLRNERDSLGNYMAEEQD